MSETERDGDESGVKVTDRRLFTSDGQLRTDLPEGAESEATPAADPEPSPAETAGAGFERRPIEEPKGVDFTMLINAMAEPALLFLGEIAYPGADAPTVDLDRAKIQVDMLELLRVKCRGNMTPEEESLLDRILYRLRMLYVAKANQPQQSG